MTDFATLAGRVQELTASVNSVLDARLSLTQTRHVNQSTGNDNNDGLTTLTSKRSIKSAIESISGGHINVIVNGNYTLGLHSEDNDLIIWNKTVIIRSNYVSGNYPTFTFARRTSSDRVFGSTGRSVRNFSFNGFAGLQMWNWRIILPTLSGSSTVAVNPHGTPFNFFAPEPGGFTSLGIFGGEIEFTQNNHVTLMNGGAAITQPTALYMSNIRSINSRTGRFINTQLNTATSVQFHTVSGGIITDTGTESLAV